MNKFVSSSSGLRCFLLESENGKWQLSLRPSRWEDIKSNFHTTSLGLHGKSCSSLTHWVLVRLDAENAKQAKDPEVLSVDHLEAGQIIRGYVKSAGEQGVFIR